MRDDRTPDPLDALIDDVAQTMTGEAPPVAMRGRVRERIEQPARTRWHVPAWQAAVGAASLAAVAIVIVGRAMFGAPGGPNSARPTETQLRPPLEQELTAVTNVPETPVLAEPAPRVVRIAAETLTLPPEELIVVDPIALEPIDPPVVAVDVIPVPMPLGAEHIEIAPIVIQ